MYGETLKFSPQPPPALNSTAIAQTAVAPSQPSVIQVAPQKQPENIVTQQTKNEPMNRSIQQEKKPSVIEHKAQSSDSIKSEIKNQQERNPSVKPIKKVVTLHLENEHAYLFPPWGNKKGAQKYQNYGKQESIIDDSRRMGNRQSDKG